LRPIGRVDDAVDDDQVGLDDARRRRLRCGGLRSLRTRVEGEGAGKRGAEAEKFSACVLSRSAPPSEPDLLIHRRSIA